MTEHLRSGHPQSRRELLKTTLKAGAYITPLILTSMTVGAVAAATPAPAPLLCTQPVIVLQDVVVTGFDRGSSVDAGAPNITYDVYYTLSTQPVGTFTLLGTLPPTDALGVAGAVFPLSADSSVVTGVTLTLVLSGRPPTNAIASFTSRLVTTLACQAGGPRAAAQLIGRVFQEPTTCPTLSTQFTDRVDAVLVNASPSTTYTFSIQPNNSGSAVAIGTFTTNAQGNVTVVQPASVTTTTPVYPLSSVLSAVPVPGSPPTAVPFTTTLSGTTNVKNIACQLPGAAQDGTHTVSFGSVA